MSSLKPILDNEPKITSWSVELGTPAVLEVESAELLAAEIINLVATAGYTAEENRGFLRKIFG